MANGASTALFQQAIQMLLQGRQPSPLAPVPAGPMTPPGGFLPPPMGAPPEPAPVAPMPAQNQALIEQLTGPRPVAPVAQPDSLLMKIARALQGFGAGTQGQGPQFLAGLREERERPQREFRAATEQFEGRRRGAIEFDEGLRQRGQQDIQRRADIQSGREFQLFETEQRDRMQEARDLRLQAKQLEIEDRRARAELAESERKDKTAKEKQRNDIAADLVKSPNFAPQRIANEIADAQVYGKPLSPAAEKWRSVQARKAEAQLANLNKVGTGSGSTGPVMAQLENGMIVPMSAVNTGGDLAGRAVINGKALRVVGYVGGKIPQQAQPQQPAPQLPSNMFPEFSGQLAGAPQQSGKTVTMDAVRRHATKVRISPDTALQQFKDAGYTIQP